MSFRTSCAAALLGTSAVALVAGCVLEPGTAALTFEGELAGHGDGPKVTCPAPGGAAFSSLEWIGAVGTAKVTVTLAGLSSATFDHLTIVDGARQWAAVRGPEASPMAPGTFTTRMDEHGVVHVDGLVKALNASTPGQVSIRGTLRCPTQAP